MTMMTIRTRRVERCPNCGLVGLQSWPAQCDDLFGAPGEWGFSKCPGPACGLLWLDPAPLPEDLHLAYMTDYVTHKDPTLFPIWRRHIEELLTRAALQSVLGYSQGLSTGIAFMGHLATWFAPAGTDAFLAEAMYLPAPSRSHKLLDVGCGSGAVMARMQGLGWDPIGLDFDSKALAVAKAKGLQVRMGGTLALKSLEGPFEAIILSHVIEHLPDGLEVLKECVRLLEPGGRLVLATPNSASMGFRMFRNNWRGLEPPRHLCIYNQRNLACLVEKSGLKIESTKSTARAARYILGRSLGIWWMRRKDIAGTPDLGNFMHLVSLVLQVLERVFLLVSPSSGEEIILIGRKAEMRTKVTE